MPERSLGGSWYFITFVDDCTRKVWAYSLRSKDKALTVFSQWLAKVENKTGQRVKTLRSEKRGKYTSQAFKQYLSEKGIWHQKTVPHTPMQNGIAERINRMIQDRVTIMLQHFGLKLESGPKHSRRLYT